jgi:hypothetical protein
MSHAKRCRDVCEVFCAVFCVQCSPEDGICHMPKDVRTYVKFSATCSVCSVFL